MRPRARRARVTAAALLVLTLAACGTGEATTGPCVPVRREPLDPRSVHVLPGAEDPGYQTDPPTSGPHLPSPVTGAVRSEPLPAPIQVGILEEGGVLIQHAGLVPSERAEVEALGGDGVVVAPARILPDDATVVATAWVTKQVCDGVDTEALRAFATDHRDDGPGGHG